jgi:hypothetical protein
MFGKKYLKKLLVHWTSRFAGLVQKQNKRHMAYIMPCGAAKRHNSLVH